MDVFKLSRDWFDFSFENPEKIKPNHAALYFFCIEHCNRLGWKGKFGLPTTMAKEAIGINSYNTYINTLRDLCDWGFIKMIEKSKNQYSSNIIAISNFDKALDKALDKAMIKHSTKHVSKQSESIDSIDIQETRNKKQETIINNWKTSYDIYFEECVSAFKKIQENEPFISKQEYFYPSVNIAKTMESSFSSYWKTKRAWDYKRKQKIENIDWEATITNIIKNPKGRIYFSKQEQIEIDEKRIAKKYKKETALF